MKKLLLLSLFLSGYIFALGQNFPPTAKPEKQLFFSLRYGYGDVIAHRKNMEAITNQPYHFVDVKVGLQTLGQQQFHALLNYPAFGVGYSKGSLGYNKIYGLPNALYGFVDFPVFRAQKLRISLEPSIGFAFSFKAYDPVTNPENIAIGSAENAYLRLRIATQLYLAPQWDLDLSLDYTHFSNGNTRSPNLGLNTRGGSIGFNYYFNRKQYFDPKNNAYQTTYEPFTANHSIVMRYGYGVRSSDETFRFYNVHDLGLYYSYQLSPVYAVTIGSDVFYNEAYRLLLHPFQQSQTQFEQLLSVGIYAENELILNQVSFVLGIGAYAYHGNSAQEESIYWRLGARYRIIDPLWVQVALKAHASVAEFVEWSVAYQLRFKKKR